MSNYNRSGRRLTPLRFAEFTLPSSCDLLLTVWTVKGGHYFGLYESDEESLTAYAEMAPPNSPFEDVWLGVAAELASEEVSLEQGYLDIDYITTLFDVAMADASEADFAYLDAHARVKMPGQIMCVPKLRKSACDTVVSPNSQLTMDFDELGPKPIAAGLQAQGGLPQTAFEPIPTMPVETYEVDPHYVSSCQGRSLVHPVSVSALVEDANQTKKRRDSLVMDGGDDASVGQHDCSDALHSPGLGRIFDRDFLPGIDHLTNIVACPVRVNYNNDLKKVRTATGAAAEDGREEPAGTAIVRGESNSLPSRDQRGDKKNGSRTMADNVRRTEYNEGEYIAHLQPQPLSTEHNQSTDESGSSTAVDTGSDSQLDEDEDYFVDVDLNSIDDGEISGGKRVKRQGRPKLTINTQLNLRTEGQGVGVNTATIPTSESMAFADRRGHTKPLKIRRQNFLDSDDDEDWETITQEEVEDAEWHTDAPSDSIVKDHNTLPVAENVLSEVCADLARTLFSRRGY